MSSSKEVWIVAIAVLVMVVLVGFFTNWYGLAAPAPTPAPVNNQAATKEAVQEALPEALKESLPEALKESLPEAINSALAQREKAEARKRAELAEAKADSIAAAKAEKAAKELAAMPAKVRRLEKELAALKAAKVASASATEEINIAPAMKEKELQQKKAAAPASNMNAKTFEYKLEASDPATKKIGVTLNGWTEYKPGETISLSPGVYGFNAENSVTWAYDSVSMRMGKANFVVIVGGLELNTPGSDNKRSGANAYVCVNEDGTLTLIE